jgi:hypothetical protein
LLRKEADSDYYAPNWQIQAHVTRKQLFPAGKTITVEHSYKPIAGGSVGGMLSPEYRKESEYFAEYQAAYCIDSAFLKGFDKRIYAERAKANARGDEYGVAYVEHWLDYVLKSGRQLERADQGLPARGRQGKARQSGQLLHGWGEERSARLASRSANPTSSLRATSRS